jgi:hypothetical protein
MLQSPQWKKLNDINKFVASKYSGLTPPNFDDDSLYIPWIKENFHLTKFESVEQVLSLRNEWKLLNIDVEKENLHLYDLMSKASKEQLRVILLPFKNLN